MNLKSFIVKLTQKLDWHPERCSTFAHLVLGLIQQGNVQHHALSLGFYGTLGKLKAKLERIRRFFANQITEYETFGLTIVTGFFHGIPKMHLILDRTTWKFGKRDVNDLMLAARVGEITFPLFCRLLDHQGCSDAKERIELMDMFRRAFGFNKVLSFTADREFIGEEWLGYLCNNHVPFLSASKIIA